MSLKLNVVGLPKDCIEGQIVESFLLGKDAASLACVNKELQNRITHFINQYLQMFSGVANTSDVESREYLRALVHSTVIQNVSEEMYEKLKTHSFLERYIRDWAKGEQDNRLQSIREIGSNQTQKLTQYAIDFASEGFICEALFALESMRREGVAVHGVLERLVDAGKIKEAIQLATEKAEESFLSNLLKSRDFPSGTLLQSIEVARPLSPVSERVLPLVEYVEDSLARANRFSRFEAIVGGLNGDVIIRNVKKITLAQSLILFRDSVLFNPSILTRFRLENPLHGAFVQEVIRKRSIEDAVKAAEQNGGNEVIAARSAGAFFSTLSPTADEDSICLRFREVLSDIHMSTSPNSGSLLKILEATILKLKEDGREEDMPIIENLQQLRVS